MLEITVEQLANGSVTLWFEPESKENWNAETLTCTDGENSVTVTGCSDITLKFEKHFGTQYQRCFRQRGRQGDL